MTDSRLLDKNAFCLAGFIYECVYRLARPSLAISDIILPIKVKSSMIKFLTTETRLCRKCYTYHRVRRLAWLYLIVLAIIRLFIDALIICGLVLLCKYVASHLTIVWR